MSILIISPGKKHSPEMAAMIGEYEKRLRGSFEVAWKFISAGEVKDESAAILRSIGSDDFVILLDEKGIVQGSVQFSEMLEKAVIGGAKKVVFIIGGAYGVDESVRERAKKVISISAMTLPHMIVRLFLVEQIYRASQIAIGGKYHHA
ncbi:MAG: 23S rRNA (pseudouridine(1915)-N(3))-methyltransferase RlmH [Candidatus Pacebacteria bacterium]|nr:23S rRNA (pseudouridine(1915)-N(3))-methyltransferase RlmH [Candidatus Paceibacterota bacterium]